MPARLAFVRHAESELGARGLVNGDPSVDCPLTERGRRQAAELRAALARDPVDVCITTSFPRTQETARIALEDLEIPLEIEPGLDDPRVGIFESRPADEYLDWLGAHDWSRSPEGGGESQLACVRRYLDAFERLLARNESRMMVIAHAFPMGVAWTLATEPPPTVRPHYNCDFDYLSRVEIDPLALSAGITRARQELASIDRP